MKTGTLTEDGLDLHGVVPVKTENESSHKFEELKEDCTSLGENEFLFGMATCHSLTRIDNELCGDPLDAKMFEATGWVSLKLT